MSLVAGGAQAQTRGGVEMEDGRVRDPMPIFDRDEVERIQRQRAEAMRRNIEIEHDLRRRQTSAELERTGRTTWNLWY